MVHLGCSRKFVALTATGLEVYTALVRQGMQQIVGAVGALQCTSVEGDSFVGSTISIAFFHLLAETSSALGQG